MYRVFQTAKAWTRYPLAWQDRSLVSQYHRRIKHGQRIGTGSTSSLSRLGEHAELLQHAHRVQIRPVFHQLTASHTEDVILCPRYLLAGGRHPHHFPLVRPTRSQAGHHGLPLGHRLLRRPLKVREGTGIDDEEVFEAFGATHGGGTARPAEAMVGCN